MRVKTACRTTVVAACSPHPTIRRPTGADPIARRNAGRQPRVAMRWPDETGLSAAERLQLTQSGRRAHASRRVASASSAAYVCCR
eukprot:970912-Rhodomonas_salina.1